MHPENAYYHILKVTCYAVTLDNFDSALVSINNTLALNQNIPDANQIKGAILYKQEKYDSALVYLNKTIRLDSSNTGGWYTRAKEIQKNPKSTKAYYFLG